MKKGLSWGLMGRAQLTIADMVRYLERKIMVRVVLTLALNKINSFTSS